MWSTSIAVMVSVAAGIGLVLTSGDGVSVTAAAARTTVPSEAVDTTAVTAPTTASSTAAVTRTETTTATTTGTATTTTTAAPVAPVADTPAVVATTTLPAGTLTAGSPTAEVAELQRQLNAVTGSGAIVMVNGDVSPSVVRDCVASGIPRVWLFKGVGGPGAVSDEAVRIAHDNGLSLVEGACPLMFLESPGWVHRIHRFIRRRNGGVMDDLQSAA